MNPEDREWQAQERAMQIERDGVDMTEADGLSASYLGIARALREPLGAALPADFAERMAAMVASRRQPVEIESRFEQTLLVALCVVMGLSALVALLVYGSGDWVAPLTDSFRRVGRPPLTWSLAVAACLSLSWFAQHLRNRGEDGHRHLA